MAALRILATPDLPQQGEAGSWVHLLPKCWWQHAEELCWFFHQCRSLACCKAPWAPGYLLNALWQPQLVMVRSDDLCDNAHYQWRRCWLPLPQDPQVTWA
jgi:hypothetical protein